MQKVKIKSGEYEFIGELQEEKAPKTCEMFKGMLPLKSRFIHVRWSGEGVWIPYGDFRTGLDYENHISHPAIGEMLLYPGGISEMEMILSYGRCCFACQYGQLAGNHFLTIIKGRDKLYEFGRKVLLEGAQDIEIDLI
ncbi:DUF3830 family protein [Bacillota bacterium]